MGKLLRNFLSSNFDGFKNERFYFPFLISTKEIQRNTDWYWKWLFFEKKKLFMGK